MSGIEKYFTHFIELRRRILYCVLGFILLLIPLVIFSGKLYTLVATPILNTLPLGAKLIATGVITPFTSPIKLAVFTSFILIIPYIFYHFWAFVKPGLYPKEKHFIFPILILCSFLFYLGMAFAHFVVCPLALQFFMQIAPKGVTVMTDMTEYLDFILMLYVAFGLSFQIPIITFLMIRMGIVSVETLKKQRPFIIVGAFVIGMLLTPPDVISQCLLAIPLLILFESGLLLTKLLPPKRSKQDDTNNARKDLWRA